LVFSSLATLFKDMYEYMNKKGLNLSLIEGGEEIYVNAIRKTFGRNNYAVCAFKDKEMIGFGIGSLRITPPYLGSIRIGAVTHLYLNHDARGKGLAMQIMKGLDAWFKEKEVHSVELEVLCENELGRNFWQQNGFVDELFKMRKA